MGRIFSTLSLLGIGLWAGKRLHIGDYLRRKRGPAVTTNEAKTAFSQASEIISSLYKHFLIFDLTYVASGMVLLLVVCYAAFATSMKGVPRGEYTLIVDFLNRAVGLAARHSLVPTTFTIVSYFAGLLTYDLADNFLYYRYDVPSRGIDWSDYEITITRESRSPDEAAVLISKYERVTTSKW